MTDREGEGKESWIEIKNRMLSEDDESRGRRQPFLSGYISAEEIRLTSLLGKECQKTRSAPLFFHLVDGVTYKAKLGDEIDIPNSLRLAYFWGLLQFWQWESDLWRTASTAATAAVNEVVAVEDGVVLTVRGAGHDQATLVLVAIVPATLLSRTRHHGARVLSQSTGTHKHGEAVVSSLLLLMLLSLQLMLLYLLLDSKFEAQKQLQLFL